MAGRALATMVESLTAMNMGSMTEGKTSLKRPAVLEGSKAPLGMIVTTSVPQKRGRADAPAA
jgi:hypothetical protein